MSNKQDFDATLSVAQALPVEQVKEPNMPVGIYLQEAEDLSQIAQSDKQALMAVGLPESLISLLSTYAGATREAQSLWSKERQMREEAEEQWQTEAPKGYELRDMLIHTFSYAFRKNEALLKRVKAIREGHGHSDMVQDLNDLAVLGKSEEPLLVQINFDMGELETARTLSDKLSTLLAQSNGERTSPNDAKELRDRMYTLLKTVVDEVRDCGKFVFWKDERKRRQYSSAYKRRMRNKQKQGEVVE